MPIIQCMCIIYTCRKGLEQEWTNPQSINYKVPIIHDIVIIIEFDLVHVGGCLRGDVISCRLSSHGSNFRLHDAPVGESHVRVKGHMWRASGGSSCCRCCLSLSSGSCGHLLWLVLLVLLLMLVLLGVGATLLLLGVLIIESEPLGSLLSFLCSYGV